VYAYLRVTAGPDLGRTFNLIEGFTTVIGRGEKAEARLNDPGVCRLHCELRCEPTGFQLVDMDSVGGTFFAGEKIQERPLKHGEEFQVGSTRMKLYTSGLSDAQKLVEAQKSADEHKAKAKAEEEILTGKTISHYELGPVLSRGAIGTVYQARNTRDGKDVAFKVVHPELTRDEEDVRRFIGAIKAAAAIRHPNLIAICGAGKHGPTCWFAMEHVEGTPLTKIIERLATVKSINWRFALLVSVQIARGLQALHEKHIIHRNVSPECILIRNKDKVAKLGGMMMAKVRDGTQAKAAARTEELVGDVAYMAPERTRSDVEVDIRADIYSLGAVFYALLTGKPPFAGKSLIDTIAQIRQADPVPPQRYQEAIPDEIQDVVIRLLAKRPELRLQTPADVARKLEQIAKFLNESSDPTKSTIMRISGHPGWVGD